MSSAFPEPSLTRELGGTLKLAAPLAAAQLAQVAMGATDTVMLGGLGRDALAAGGLGSNLYFTLMLVIAGGLTSVSILVSHARGAGQPARIGVALRGGVVLALLSAIPAMLALGSVTPMLTAIGEPGPLAAAIGRYDRVLLWAMPASLILATQRGYLAAMGRPWVVMTVAVGAVGVNGFLNYGLIHGAFGFPLLGYVGSATATLITLWGMMSVIALAIRFTPALAPHRLLGRIDWRAVREMAALGWPIAFTMAVETLLFTVTSLIVGFFGATPLAAHQIALSIASVTFMVPLSAAQAANVRVGFYLGAGSPRAARQAGVAAFLLGVGFMGVAATVLWTKPELIAGLYIAPGAAGRAEVIALSGRLLTVAAFFQVFDGAQTIAAGALRGVKDTRVPAAAATIGYWGVGFTTAWLLGVRAGMGAVGIWWGLASGIAAVAVLLSLRFWLLTGRMIAGRVAWLPAGDCAIAQTSIAE
jgi:MATE family multidrug resistance protein